MSAVHKIIGEVFTPEDGVNRSGSSGWPKIVQMPVGSLRDALALWDAGNNRNLKKAIQQAVNFDALWGAVDAWFAENESGDASSNGAGLIFDRDDDMWAVVGFLALNWSTSSLVSPVYGHKTMRVADQALAEVIGNWLKSIGVPFKYTEGQPEEKAAAPVIPSQDPGQRVA